MTISRVDRRANGGWLASFGVIGAEDTYVLLSDPLWSCIGLVTPHGRVMVGERRQAPSGAEGLVCAVLWTQPDRSGVSFDVGRGPTECLAEDVARWPLISPLIPADRDVRPEHHRCKCGEWKASSLDVCASCHERRSMLCSLGSAVARACSLAAEQGPGISRLPPPEVRPDVVVTAAWEDRWTTP